MNKITYWVLSLAMITSSCTVNEPEVPVFPAGEFTRLSLFGGDGSKTAPADSRAVWDDPNGKGSLGFKWEAVDIDSPETSKLSLIISCGDKALNNRASATAGESEGEQTFSGLAVKPNQEDAHWANFQTVRYYATDDLNEAKYLYAVSGVADIAADEDGKRHVCHLEMPSVFSQTQDQDPSFLRDYMFMYATAPYEGNGTQMTFTHIPATFRFIISNGSESAVSLQSVSVSVLEGGAVASKFADVTFGWASSEARLSFGTESYESITTDLPDNWVTVETGKRFIAYSMALPLASNDAFKGKALMFSALKSNGETLTFILDGETLASANGSGIYNWVSKKSYTINFKIGEGGKATGTILSNKDITVASTLEGEYTLKYVDASGEALANYADICTLTIDQMTTYEDFIDANIAPYAADAIGIFDAAGVKVGSIAINTIKADDSGLLYSVGMLSDVHLNTQNSYYSDSFTDFDSALKFFNSPEVNVAFTCTCGDITENAVESELAKYQEIVQANPSTPVYTTSGNHDATQSGINEALWKQYTGYGLTYEVSKTLPNGKTDHYLFLGMSVWNFAEAYTSANLMWLKSRLEAYKNERCFVITHLFFPDGAGNMLNIYPEGNWLRGVQLNALKDLRERYVNSIWFSGHSHWKWSLQKFEDEANIYRHQGAGWGVHIPSCAKPSDSNGIPNSGDAARQEKRDQSEGAVINVYENHIDVLGVDLIAEKYLPIATYRLDTTLEEVEDTPLDETVLTADKFTKYKGTGEMSITDVPDMPGYIDVIFTANGQGYYVKNSTFTEGHDSNQVFDLELDYLQCWTGWGTDSQTEVATIDRVGFYSGDYNLVSTKNCYVDALHGVQFQTKSSCDADFPIKLRMKARGKFYLKDEDQDSLGETLTAADFIHNPDKNAGATITDVGGGYIEAIFTMPSQGFWMTNSTFTPGYDTTYQPVDISISGLQCWTNWNEATGTGTEVATIDKVGFYSGSYNLATTDKCYVDANYGVQFQTSSSCKGPFPIKIRMKVTAYFNLSSSAPSLPSQPSPYISASDFAINPVKVNKNKDVTEFVKDVEGMPNYVDVTFAGKSEGFFISHSTHTSSTKKVDVVIEDAKALDDNGAEMAMPANVGFYGYLSGQAAQTYNMAQEMSFYNLPAEGVAFQTSSSCPGPYPFTVRMKVITKFY